MDPPLLPPTELDPRHAGYLICAVFLGALSALASLLGSEHVMTKRVIASYVIAGGVCSLAVVLLLVEQYGFSYFLVGAGILSGYKAFDVLALLSVAIRKLADKFIVTKSPPNPPAP